MTEVIYEEEGSARTPASLAQSPYRAPAASEGAPEPQDALEPVEDPTFAALEDAEAEVAEADRSRRAQGVPVAEDQQGTPAKEWADPTEAFLSQPAGVLPQMVFPIDRAGGPDPVTGVFYPPLRTRIVLRGMPTARYEALVNSFTSMKFDRATGGRYEETDEKALKAELILECVANMQLRTDERLYAHYKAKDPHHLVSRIFLHGEIENLAVTIARLSGHERTFAEEQAGNS